MAASHHRRSPGWLKVLVLVWAVLVLGWMAALMWYFSKPGESDIPPTRQPDTTLIHTSSDQPCLLLFAHPKCPCTRASLTQFVSLVREFEGSLQSYVIFIQPTGKNSQWLAGDLLERAKAEGNITVVFDEGLVITRQFRAKTSGHVLLYRAGGQLLFSGGITLGRGHEGSNVGYEALRQCLAEQVTQARPQSYRISSSKVFGCPLFSRED